MLIALLSLFYRRGEYAGCYNARLWVWDVGCRQGSDMKRITIIGLGLIGGSLGLALKESGVDEVVGWDLARASVTRALKMGAIDKDGKTLAGSVEGAELVIIATPLLAMPDVMQEISPSLSPRCVVTDTGSTKTAVMEWAETYLPGVDFIGGHPMGRQRSAWNRAC